MLNVIVSKQRKMEIFMGVHSGSWGVSILLILLIVHTQEQIFHCHLCI